jgi:hypothetical protein
MLREILSKALLSFWLTLFFKIYGITFLVGYMIGVEFMQACYRSFKDGYHWEDLYKKPLILKNYLKPKDTAIDILSYAGGIAFAILFWRLPHAF